MEGLNEQQKMDLSIAQARFTTKVFAWMGFGLLLTALMAHFTINSPTMWNMLSGGGFLVFIVAEIGVVIFLSSRIHKMRASTAKSAFIIYSLLSGVTFAAILARYTSESVSLAFFITAGIFGIMATYGYVTKTDLLKLRSLFVVGIIGLVLASVVNIFVGSSSLYWAITYIGVILFIGLVAYDAQKIKAFAIHGLRSEEDYGRFVILGALTLYLDFINLFIFVLRIIGKRK